MFARICSVTSFSPGPYRRREIRQAYCLPANQNADFIAPNILNQRRGAFPRSRPCPRGPKQASSIRQAIQGDPITRKLRTASEFRPGCPVFLGERETALSLAPSPSLRHDPSKLSVPSGYSHLVHGSTGFAASAAAAFVKMTPWHLRSARLGRRMPPRFKQTCMAAGPVEAKGFAVNA